MHTTFTLWLGYRQYARDSGRHTFPSLWAAREILWDHCPGCFDFYYRHFIQK